MRKEKFSKAWKGSSQPRKQHKYRFRSPLHIKQKLMHVHLSPELRKKYALRNCQTRIGDKVKILRGQFRKKEGRIERINLKRGQVFITGAERIKKEGTKLLVPIHPSNLMIIELNLDDKKRRQKIESKLKTAEAKTKRENKEPKEKTEVKK